MEGARRGAPGGGACLGARFEDHERRAKNAVNMKESDLLLGGLSVGAVVETEFASAWEPGRQPGRQCKWMARDVS